MVELRVFRGYHFIEEDAGYHTKWQERIDPLMSTASTRFCSIWCDCSDDGTGNWLFCFPLSSTHSSILGTNFLLDLSSGSMFLFFLPLLHHINLIFFFFFWRLIWWCDEEGGNTWSFWVPLVVLISRPFWFSTPALAQFIGYGAVAPLICLFSFLTEFLQQ